MATRILPLRLDWLSYVLGATLLVVASSTLQAQSRADSLFAMGEYADAAEAYQARIAGDASNPGLWFRYAYSHHMLENFDKAKEGYRQAIDLANHPVSMYNLACVNARTGQETDALRWLDSAVANGFSNIDLLEKDEELASIRERPGFAAIVRRARESAHPCRYDDRYRALDFWVGEWAVYTPQGNRAGTNRLQRVVGDCAIAESWEGSFMHGVSYTTYDRDADLWRQTWIDDKGGVLLFEGEFVDNALVLTADDVDRNGNRVKRRMTVRPIGEFVEQHGELSTDGGNTWTTEYKLEYRPLDS